MNIVIFPYEVDGVPQRNMVDVGFGGDGPTRPLPLTPSTVAQNLGTQEVKLMHENIALNVDPGQRLWFYKIRNSEGDEWKDCYCFPELEFLSHRTMRR